MCFSATASFVAGTTLSAAGIATITKTKRKSERLFASIPLLFGIQQLVEGFVWLSLRYHSMMFNVIMSHAYFLFSDVWWPVFVPLSVFCLESVRWRKNTLSVFELLGCITAAYFLYFFFTSPIHAAINGHCLSYSHPEFLLPVALCLYVISACGSFLVASNTIVKAFGITALILLFIAYEFYKYAFVSVWCFFAAILSFIVVLCVTSGKRISDHKN